MKCNIIQFCHEIMTYRLCVKMSLEGWYWGIHVAQGGVQLGEEAVCVCGFEAGFHYVAGLRSDWSTCLAQAHTSTASKPCGLSSLRIVQGHSLS